MNKKLLIINLAILALLGLVGCASKTNPLRILKMNEDVCEPPCWMGIIPAETSFKDAYEIVSGLEFFSQRGEIKVDENEEFLLWQSGLHQNAHISFDNGIVSLISFYFPETELGNVIEEYGTPDFYRTYAVNYEIDEENEVYYGIDIIYPEIGLVFQVIGQEPISEDLVVLGAFFTGPGTVEEIAAEILAPGQNLIIQLDFFPWEGFGVCPRGLQSEDLCQK
jgi:hypothetical protein